MPFPKSYVVPGRPTRRQIKERRSIEKYDAIGSARNREGSYKRDIMTARKKLQKFCKQFLSGEFDLPEEEAVELTSLRTLMGVVESEVIPALDRTRQHLDACHNDIHYTTFAGTLHWWRELFNDFMEWGRSVEPEKAWEIFIPANAIDGPVKHARKFCSLEARYFCELDENEWTKEPLFANFMATEEEEECVGSVCQ